jgi:hypothetical protein
MKNIPAEKATHRFGPPGNWEEKTDGTCDDLHVRAGAHGDRNLPTWTSAWQPTQEDIAKLLLGGEIEITLIGAQPPMQVNVVLPTNISKAEERPHITINEEAHGLGYDEHGPATP